MLRTEYFLLPGIRTEKKNLKALTVIVEEDRPSAWTPNWGESYDIEGI